MNYGFIKKIDLSFDDALVKVTDELKKEGFGILTTIDAQEKFKEKLNIDFPKYKILGACNPAMAHKAISMEWNVGLLLPCNVIVYEKENSVWVGIIKPSQAMAMVENDELKEIAAEVEAKLKTVFEGI
ncbi:DUF302 domain-containing protein [candidate division WOR-3 bacterium]|jgi:uncharacterized protein (DUF302 family)|nr:DUF302 domain-containing protein [candidate division WOR-3 bacterium]